MQIPAFRIDLRELVASAEKRLDIQVAQVSVNFPGVSISGHLDEREAEVAREVVIRLKDRRVLDAKECCDSCIDQAIESIQEIRRFLVDLQVRLSDRTDSLVYFLLEFMLEPIRQFLTFQQRLIAANPEHLQGGRGRAPEVRDEYFRALAGLRGHLRSALREVAEVAGLDPSKLALRELYEPDWGVDLYLPLSDETPRLTNGGDFRREGGAKEIRVVDERLDGSGHLNGTDAG